MLAQTLFLVAIIAIFATSAVAGIAGYARAEAATAAKALIVPSIETALARYESQVIAPTIAAASVRGDGSAPPAAAAPLNGGTAWDAAQYVLAPAAGSPLASVVTITPTATSVPACSPAGGAVNAGTDVEINGQCSPFVQESRLSVAVVVDAGPATSARAVAPIAHGRVTVTMRLFAQPPYVMIAGIKDDPAPGDPHEGDTGGYGNAIRAFGPGLGPDDTTIHVMYACTPGTGDCSGSNPPSPDQPTSLPWANGNATP